MSSREPQDRSLVDVGPLPHAISDAATQAESEWELRSDLARLTAQVKGIRAQIATIESARQRSSLKRLSPQQAAVLGVLADHYYGCDWNAFPFKSLSSRTGLTRNQVARACRALRRYGFAKHEINLWTEDGEMVGAGYRATSDGAAYHRQSGNTEPADGVGRDPRPTPNAGQVPGMNTDQPLEP